MNIMAEFVGLSSISAYSVKQRHAGKCEIKL